MQNSFLEQQLFVEGVWTGSFSLKPAFLTAASYLFPRLVTFVLRYINVFSFLVLNHCTIFPFFKQRKIEAIFYIIYSWSWSFSCTRKWFLVIWRWHLYFTVKASILFFSSLYSPPSQKQNLSNSLQRKIIKERWFCSVSWRPTPPRPQVVSRWLI